MQGLKKARLGILRAKSIAIAGHINPDGDSLGSLLALGLGLEKLGKRVYMLCADEIPSMYHFLPGVKDILNSIKKKVDLAISVDCSVEELLGENIRVFKKAKSILEIDHHEFRRDFGDIKLVDDKAAAVGELVYMLLKALNIRITPEIAENLLTSILAETNSFKLPSVRPYTFKLCAKLLDTGVDFYGLAERVYWSKPKESAVLSGLCLSRCKFLKKGRIAWSIIRRKDFAKIKGRDYNIDAVANEIRSIKGVMIVVLFREKNKRLFRVSLRSKGEINIASIAERYNGGGHFDVAGCYIKNNTKSMKELLEFTEDLLKQKGVY
ncbi:MAG: DHH family phosphoesterase [Candidatus Omnitrophota bacterium]